MDLRKAYDSVTHSTLSKALLRAGTSSTFIRAIMAMYDKFKACVRANNDLTDFSDCPHGLKQGCVASPTLFSIIINEIAIHTGLVELLILLFADDIILMSVSQADLQTQLDCLQEACEVRNREVNCDKTKIMIFRKGGYVKKCEKWFIYGKELEIVNSYVYLGFLFTTILILNQSVTHLAKKKGGKTASFDVIPAYRRLDPKTKDTFFKIFDTQIQPVLLYAVEVWGTSFVNSPVEKVYTYVCKNLLGVSKRTPNIMAYGEIGRYPPYITCYIRVLKYWFHMLHMSNDRILKQAYLMLKNLDEQGKVNWASKTK